MATQAWHVIDSLLGSADQRIVDGNARCEKKRGAAVAAVAAASYLECGDWRCNRSRLWSGGGGDQARARCSGNGR